uniref:BHLH domain-containing protein n=1 Tax=Oryza brachyantha TaxID=4533 RepID=J3M2X2_ORYBR
MISERHRREWITTASRRSGHLLPPGSKRDKAAVLANTTEYMDKLILQVSELEEKNRQLEAQLAMHAIAGEPQQTGGSGEESSERIRVDVAIAGSLASHRSREVSIRVAVRAECDVSKLVVAVLSRLSGMGCFGVVSVDARQRNSSLVCE